MRKLIESNLSVDINFSRKITRITFYINMKGATNKVENFIYEIYI